MFRLVPAQLSLIAYPLLLDRDIADSDQTLLVLAHINLITIIVKVVELGRDGSYSLLAAPAVYGDVPLIVAATHRAQRLPSLIVRRMVWCLVVVDRDRDVAEYVIFLALREIALYRKVVILSWWD